MNRREVKEVLLDLLVSKNHISLEVDISDIDENTSLINDVALDSIQLLELIVAIENRFKFNINTDEVTIDIFDVFSRLIDFVEGKVNRA